jgi:ATP-dependent Clp protease ATP-binding subunit ClpC
MFDRLSVAAQQVLHLSVEEVRALRHDWIGTEHLLLGLLRYEEIGGPLFGTQPLADLEVVRAKVIKPCPPGKADPVGNVPFTPRMKTIFDIVGRHTKDLSGRTIQPRHLLYGLLVDGDGVAVHVLRDLGADLAALTARAAV